MELEDVVNEEMLTTEDVNNMLEHTDKGRTKQTIRNCVTVLQNDPVLEKAIKRNELSGRMDIVKEVPWERRNNSPTVTDTDENNLKMYLEENYELTSERVIKAGIDIVSNENKYHPIRDYLESLVWDRIPRIENMLPHFLGAEKSKYTIGVMKMHMLAAISRIYEPGIKYDIMLCLVGSQGAGKSTFFKYSDMNMRYLRISGILQRKGRGMIIVPAKHILAEKLAKSTSNEEPIMVQYKRLCEGAELPTDNMDTAKALLNDLIKQMKGRQILFNINDLPLNTAAEINIARRRLENILSQTDEIQYAKEQCNQWQEIADYMELLIKGGGKRTYDDDNVIEVPKDETPAYLEWILWRASLAIDHMVNKPYEVRGFKLDSDFLPVSAAGGGKGDLYCEFNDFTILTEVTMSTSSRQEAMEGEPVRRHVSDAVLKYDKPVYGMFIAVKIDTNTAETFRHGIWYARGDLKQRLDIVPLTLAQYREYFMAMFRTGHANPEKLRELILLCETRRDILNAPGWKAYIGNTVDEKIKRMEKGPLVSKSKELPIVPPGANICHLIYGEGRVVAMDVYFPEAKVKDKKIPYLVGIPDEISLYADGKTILHERYGEGIIRAYVVAFQNEIIPLCFPKVFSEGCVKIL